MRKPSLPAVLAVLAALGPAPLLAQATTKPSLVVVLSLDGLSWSRLEHYRPWYVAGLKRLLEEGQVETGARYRHLNTETSPGHAALATGAPPRVTGVVANRWIEQNPDGSMRSVGAAQPWATDVVPGQPPLFYREVEKDGRLHVFALARELELWERSGETGRAIVRLGEGPAGETVVFDSEDAITLFNLAHGRPKESFRPTTTATGPGNLRVPTLGDRLVEASPQSRVVVVSGKDRTTVFLAGRDRRHVAYWYDQETGRFVTSSAYDTFGVGGAAGRALVARFNAQKAGSQLPVRFGTLWERLPAPAARVGFGDPALPAPASGLVGLPAPHERARVPPRPAALRARVLLRRLHEPVRGRDHRRPGGGLHRRRDLPPGPFGGPDLLVIGFSAQDVVSHSYGNESEENLDTIRRLDLQVGRVFDALERSLPRGSYVVAMSADHGFALIPEAEKARNPAFTGGRLVNTERAMPTVYERLNRYLSQQLCLPAGSRPVFGGEGWNVAYNRPAFPMRTVEGPCGPADRQVTLADLDRAFPKAVATLFSEEVETVLLVSERDRWPADNPATDFARNDFDAERSGDAFLVPRPGVLMHWDPGRGSHHGSHHEYDTHVPLVFWGKPFPAGRQDRDTTPYDLAPTLAESLGVTLPERPGRACSAADRYSTGLPRARSASTSRPR